MIYILCCACDEITKWLYCDRLTTCRLGLALVCSLRNFKRFRTISVNCINCLVSCNGNSLCSVWWEPDFYWRAFRRTSGFSGFVCATDRQTDRQIDAKAFGLCVSPLCKLTSLTNALLTSKLGDFYHPAWNTWRCLPDYAGCMSPGNDA
jgi:hypothetical protein